MPKVTQRELICSPEAPPPRRMNFQAQTPHTAGNRMWESRPWGRSRPSPSQGPEGSSLPRLSVLCDLHSVLAGLQLPSKQLRSLWAAWPTVLCRPAAAAGGVCPLRTGSVYLYIPALTSLGLIEMALFFLLLMNNNVFFSLALPPSLDSPA